MPMISPRLAATALACFLAIMVPGGASALAAPAPVGQERWDAPPPEFHQIERLGFRDGIDGARKDFGNHRRPNVNNRDEYRHPRLPRDQWEPYRQGFRRGYEQAAAHLWGGPPPPHPVQPPPPPSQWQGWDSRPQPGDEVRQRGFQEGMLGGLKDLINQRRPDPENRDEYRHPDVPYPMFEPYRDGFRRGYRIAIEEISGDQFRGRDHGPGDEARQRGFELGFAGAIRDFGNHRRPDPNNRDEYRHPDVPYPMLEPYREGFRRGYRRSMALLQGGAEAGDADRYHARGDQRPGY